MVSSTESPTPVLVTLKAVDPAVFPFYGKLEITPAGTLKDRLQADTVVLSDDARARLKVDPGEHVRIGGLDFRVAGIVTVEPDRMSGSFTVGPRVMLSREALDRTGLLRFGQPRFASPAPEDGTRIAARDVDSR